MRGKAKSEVVRLSEKPSHFLLEKAQTYPVFTGDLSPSGCCYNIEIGAWLLKGTMTLFVETPGRDKPKTKKFDLETGEDHKSQ